MGKHLIINADDFGYSVGVTDGILRAHREGVLTSATLMVTMPDAERAVEIAKATPTLGVGVHLCLTQGRPCGALRRLTLKGADGVETFPRSYMKLFRKLMLSAGARRDAEAEWAGQVEYVLKRGVKPTHLDSHKHVHHFPFLSGLIVRLAQRYEIPYVRCAREKPIHGLPYTESVPMFVLRRLAGRMGRRLEGTGVRTTDWFYGLSTTGETDGEVLLRLLQACPDGVGELMVHPGDPIGLTREQTRLIEERRVELEALCDPSIRVAARQANVTLTHYGRLGSLV